jgi:hypothetical protein
MLSSVAITKEKVEIPRNLVTIGRTERRRAHGNDSNAVGTQGAGL